MSGLALFNKVCVCVCVCVCVVSSDSRKTQMQLLEEEAMITELVELVSKRDALLWKLDEEKKL